MLVIKDFRSQKRPTSLTHTVTDDQKLKWSQEWPILKLGFYSMTNFTVLHLIWSSIWNIQCGLKTSGYYVKAVMAIQFKITVLTTNVISNSLKTKSAFNQRAFEHSHFITWEISFIQTLNYDHSDFGDKNLFIKNSYNFSFIIIEFLCCCLIYSNSCFCTRTIIIRWKIMIDLFESHCNWILPAGYF